MNSAARGLATEDEYLAAERRSETRHEFVNGEIVAMAGGSQRHNLIGGNLARALGNALAGRPCLVFPSDQRVAVTATGLYTYPDVTVVCGPPRSHPKDPSSLVNPILLAEVLSEATEAYDRGAKFAHYRNLPSLAEYLMVSTDERRVEHYRRIEPDQWLLTARVGATAIALPALEVTIALDDVYAKVELLDAPTA
ncbi:MAG: Uma2 family endonuclease [Myxococcales bacterium]|nr:Uma2 family endonuclease [Myxococcales bacterium]